MGLHNPRRLPPLVYWMLIATTAAFVWRAVVRFVLVGREYGWSEGMAAVLRIPVSNVIAVIAARRALFRYIGTLLGQPRRWDKTEHDRHPADALMTQAALSQEPRAVNAIAEPVA